MMRFTIAICLLLGACADEEKDSLLALEAQRCEQYRERLLSLPCAAVDAQNLRCDSRDRLRSNIEIQSSIDLFECLSEETACHGDYYDSGSCPGSVGFP